jgi:L-ascorbate metabolism protein UlaG (beta-lactamase superfamily)
MNPMRFTWLGHNCWQIKLADQTLLVDPFLDDSPTAPIKATEVSCDVVLVSHGHFDHVSDAATIAQRTGAKVLANFEVGEWLKKQGVAEGQIEAMNLGGGIDLPGGRVTMTLAHHSSSLPDGTYGGNPGGFLLEADMKRVYLACDTALFLDMKLLAHPRLDLAVLPIGDRFTMGPEASIEAIQLLNPRHVLPCHYNTWPPIAQDAASWSERVRQQTAAEPHILTPGESFDLPA